MFATTVASASSSVSVESWAGVAMLKRGPAKAPVVRSINAHLIDEPPTSTPTASEAAIKFGSAYEMFRPLFEQGPYNNP